MLLALAALATAGPPDASVGIIELDPAPSVLVVVPAPPPVALVVTGLRGDDALADGDDEEADEAEAPRRRRQSGMRRGEVTEEVAAELEAPVDELELLRQSEHAVFQPLSSSQHRWLKPSRHKLSPNPYGQTDFTAYTLEFGEVKVGLAAVTVGVAPRVQLGTVPVMNAIGIYNAHAKANLFRLKGFDAAARAAVHHLPLGGFKGTYIEAGGLVSQQLHPRLSVHGGAAYTTMTVQGVPDFSKASPLITAVTGDLSQYNPPAEFFGDKPPKIRAEALTIRTAVDFRFNRRDSVVLQGQALLRAAVVTDLGDLEIAEVLPPIAGLNEALSFEGGFKVHEAYVASIAYQATWKQVDLRVGVGISSVPYAWALQSTNLSYRFGGQTRRTERRTRKGWRSNKRDVAPPVEAVEPPPLPDVTPQPDGPTAPVPPSEPGPA